MPLQLIITYWRDIPSQVEARKSRRERQKKILNDRFMVAIDKAAMLARAHSSDDYLAGWRKSEPILSDSDNIEQTLEEVASQLERELDQHQLELLVKNKGFKT